MNHYENLLQQLRTVDKRLLRKLDHKRSPSESPARELWYGNEIPRAKLDRFLELGGFTHVEGTPMVLAIYSQYTGDHGVLFTTVGMYAANTNYQLAGKRKLRQDLKYPFRYADYREVNWKKSQYGYFSDKIDLIEKDGEWDELYCLFYPVFVSNILNLCVRYVNEHGQVEADPPIVRTQAEDDQAWAIDHLCGDAKMPVFPWRVDTNPREVPSPHPGLSPRPAGKDQSGPEGAQKMEQFRCFAKEKQTKKMTGALMDAARLGRGDAFWLIAKALSKKDPINMVSGFTMASETGSQEAAEDLELVYMIVADLALEKCQGYGVWKNWLDRALALGGSEAKCYGAKTYLKGAPGVPQDRTKALELLNEAMFWGSDRANLLLGQIYDEKPEPELREDAVNALEELARHGNAEGMLLLFKHFGMEDEPTRRLYWSYGMAAYATCAFGIEKRNVAKAMQYLAVTPGEYALWHAAQLRWSNERGGSAL